MRTTKTPTYSVDIKDMLSRHLQVLAMNPPAMHIFAPIKMDPSEWEDSSEMIGDSESAFRAGYEELREIVTRYGFRMDEGEISVTPTEEAVVNGERMFVSCLLWTEKK